MIFFLKFLYIVLLSENIHISKHIDCGPGCLSYSKEEICQSRVSDHNIYAVCKVS